MNQIAEFVGNHLFLSLSFFGLLAYWLVGEVKNRTSGIGSVSPLNATQMINHSNAVVVDVREDKEVADGLIINSIHIPLGDFKNQLKKLEKYKEKPIIVSCRSGSRSNHACSTLRKNGFQKVHNLRGGVTAWLKEGLPLVKKS
jgi:rhodanese-related sulfurtransferase